jgi:GMP synthase-like glutamine amidotransferase
LKGIILSIQNTEIETLGNFKELFESDGYIIETVHVKKDKIPKELDKYAGIVILGGYMSVYEYLPYLNEELVLINNANKLHVPLLGICLGSQLIAEALGGRVYKGKEKEIGWYDVVINNEGRNDIFRGIRNNNIKVFQWHGDTFTLPSSAVLLASSSLYPQAFRLGSSVGILFHLEVTPPMIHEWTNDYGSEMKEVGVSLDDILDGKNSEFGSLAYYCKAVYENFSNMMTAHRNTRFDMSH